MQSDVLSSCSNGYYGYQPLLNGYDGADQTQPATMELHHHQTATTASHSSGRGVLAAPVCWQRKRGRQEEEDETASCCGNGVEPISNGAAAAAAMAAKRLCPDLYHAKLQQALGLNYAPAAVAVPNGGGHNFNHSNGGVGGSRLEDGTDLVSIGTDSLMMMDEEEEGVDGGAMSNGVETLHHNNSNGHHTAGSDIRDTTGATLESSHLPSHHTCCSIRTQLCTMSFQQSYTLSATKTCPRCLAGEPVPYLSTEATVENLSKLY